MKNIFFYKTDIGEIGIAERENEITNLYFNKESILEETTVQETNILKEASEQLESYLLGRCKKFELPLAPIGTEFMKSVWSALQTIPYGETRSYGEIAKCIGKPKAYRAVGLSNYKNPIPIFIPCHRVIGTNGALVGYLGGLDMKKRLIELEKLTKK
jgi:methylated-DNA-[protein]-cysteine S-methyltransferase